MRNHLLYLQTACLLAFPVLSMSAETPHPGKVVSEHDVGKTAETVTGTVTDEKGDALPGVSVVLKGTTTGTTTDGNGKYTLSVPNQSVTLVFSFVGYGSQEVAVGNRTVVNVSLTISW